MIRSTALLTLAAVALAACAKASEAPADHDHSSHDHSAHEDAKPTDATPAQPSAAYPLTTCVVSGDPLGSMGDPVVIQHEGREVRLCCAGCVDDFKKDPKGFMAKIDAAKK